MYLRTQPRQWGKSVARDAHLRASAPTGLPRTVIYYFYIDQDNILRSTVWNPDGEVTTGGDND